MAHAYWSGQVQISLVSFGVNLYNATESTSAISMHEIDRKSGERIHHQNVNESKRPIDRSDIVKGYEYSKGKYVLLDPKELEDIRIPSRKTLEIKQFVKIEEIGLSYFEKPYFVTPEDEAQSTTFQVIRRALAEAGKAGLGEIAFGGREHLVALMAAGKDSVGMMAYTLRYAAELRDAATVFAGIKAAKIEPEQLAMAKELIEKNSKKFDAAKFRDDYETALREMIEAKRHHRPLPREAPSRGKVISLTDALRRSLGNRVKGARGNRARTDAAKIDRQRGRKGLTLVGQSAKKRRTA